MQSLTADCYNSYHDETYHLQAAVPGKDELVCCVWIAIQLHNPSHARIGVRMTVLQTELKGPSIFPRRHLTRDEAARYCAVSVTTFERICDVQPVLLSQFSSRLKRYDIRDIDAWIEARKIANSNAPPSKEDIIDGLCQ